MLSFTSYRYIKALSALLGMMTLILSFIIRSSLVSSGGSEEGVSIVSLYREHGMIIIAGLYILSFAFLSIQSLSRFQMGEERMDLMAVKKIDAGSTSEKMKVMTSGISFPILLSLMIWSVITIVRIPEKALDSSDSVILFHLLFLLHMFYINWAFSSKDMKMLDGHCYDLIYQDSKKD